MRRDYNDRLSLSEAADLVGKLLAQWPRAPTEEPYMLALAAALRAYPRCVATAAIEPATGVPREKTYGPGPTVADVVAWCDREVAWMIRAIDADNNPTLLAEKLAEFPKPPDRSQRPTLEELRHKHGPNWGLTKEDPVFTGSSAVLSCEQKRMDQKIIAEYERIGQTPVYAGDMLISPGLVRQMRGRNDASDPRRGDKS